MFEVCYSSCESLGLYILYGLDPGHFCTRLLLDDENGALQSAHRSLVMRNTIIPNMFTFVNNYIPNICKGSTDKIQNWSSHQGLYGADEKIKMIFKLQNNNNWFMNYEVPRMHVEI